VRRVHAELAVRGHRVSPQRVWRLMKATGPQGRHPRAWRKTTTAAQRPLDAPDLIRQDFTAEKPTTRWCGETTSIKTVNGWVCTVIDPHSRTVVEHALADHQRTSLLTEAPAAALATRNPPNGVMFPSDRGCQHTSHESANSCALNGVRRFLGRRATSLLQ